MRYLKNAIFHQFGITVSDSGKKNWDTGNLGLVYSSLGNINKSLNSKLKSLAGGATLRMKEYVLDPVTCPKRNCSYDAVTDGATITFNTKGSDAIRQMNIYHEFGHLIDNRSERAFSNAITGKPSWVDKNDEIADEALLKLRVTNDPNYPSVQARQTFTDFGPREQWADAFANYVAGNIRLSSSEGAAMYTFITGVLP